jgi:error-prone DNA polymerase
VVVSGLVIARQQPQTANGTVFLLLEDEHGHINVIVPKTITGNDREAMKHAMVILVLGRVERNGPVLQVIGSRFQALQVEGLTYNSRDFR